MWGCAGIRSIELLYRNSKTQQNHYKSKSAGLRSMYPFQCSEGIISPLFILESSQ
jgi:hypothetical protein